MIPTMDRRTLLLGTLGSGLAGCAPRDKPYPGLDKPLTLKTYLAQLRDIPGGTFTMGTDKPPVTTRRPDPLAGWEGGAYVFANEAPAHRVRLTDYRLGATPVTVGMWKEYCDATGTPLPRMWSSNGPDDHPVVEVSWNDVAGNDGKGGFCGWASEMAGFALTLPTEAQWEYAARGGAAGRTYPWGETFDPEKAGAAGIRFGQPLTKPVSRTFAVYRNEFGLFDMVGNVFQWCLDWYAPYKPGETLDPSGPAKCPDSNRARSQRGWVSAGGSDDPEAGWSFRCAVRRFGIGFEGTSETGFRLASKA